MENAIAELHAENTNGVLVWFFEILWKPKTERQRAASQLNDELPRIPHTVLVNYSRIQHWYFVPRSCRPGMPTVIKKKRRQNMSASNITETIKESPANIMDGAIVAQLVTRGEGHGETAPIVHFLDCDGLDRLLRRETIADTAVIQEFVIPKAGDASTKPNTVLQCFWQPNYLYVERHHNSFALTDQSRSPQERGETVEGTTFSISSALPPGVVMNRIQRTCNAIAEHVYFTTERHVRNMVLNMKVDEYDNICLQWCQSVDVVERERFLGMPSVPFVPATSAKSKKKPVRSNTGEVSALRPEDPRTLRDEKDVDAIFERLAPVLWTSTRRGSSAVRRRREEVLRHRQGSQHRPGSTTPSASSPNTPSYQHRPASAEDGLLGADRMLGLSQERSVTFLRQDNSQVVSGAPMPSDVIPDRGLQRSKPVVVGDRDSLAGEAREVISDCSWGAPSQLDNTLLKRQEREPFSLQKLAVHAGRLGFREQYLATMRQPTAKVKRRHH